MQTRALEEHCTSRSLCCGPILPPIHLPFHPSCHRRNPPTTSPRSTYFKTSNFSFLQCFSLYLMYHTYKYYRIKTARFDFEPNWKKKKSNGFFHFLPLSPPEKAQVTCIHYVNTGSLLSLALKSGGSIFKETLIQHPIHVALI